MGRVHSPRAPSYLDWVGVVAGVCRGGSIRTRLGPGRGEHRPRLLATALLVLLPRPVIP
jgi:hypothetical protein